MLKKHEKTRENQGGGWLKLVGKSREKRNLESWRKLIG
jgi:hypothetical protein